MSDLTNAGWSIYLSGYNTAIQETEIEASISQNGGTSGLEVFFTNNGKATITYNASSPPWQWTTTSPAS
jgi:hypothetical protein